MKHVDNFILLYEDSFVKIAVYIHGTSAVCLHSFNFVLKAVWKEGHYILHPFMVNKFS